MGHLPDVIHIGYPKTGSRWLDAVYQQHPQIISNTENTNYYIYDENYEKGRDWYSKFFDETAGYRPPTEIDTLELDVKDIADKKKIVIENAVYLSQGYIISEKGVVDLLTNPKTPYEQWEQYLNYNSTGKIAKRIHDTVSAARILVVIRNQIDWHISCYASSIRARVWHNVDKLNWEFKDYLKNVMEGQVNLQAAKYYDTVKTYQDIFGKEKVKVLVYEDLKADPENFLKQFYNFINIEYLYPKFPKKRVNKRLENSNIKLITFLRKMTGGKIYLVYKLVPEWLRTSVLKSVGRLFPDKTVPIVDMESEQYLKDYYRDNNKKLSELLNIDIEKYGYFF